VTDLGREIELGFTPIPAPFIPTVPGTDISTDELW
jgi:hypothetical protein